MDELIKTDWIVAQTHREDAVGQLARLWFSEKDKSKNLDVWLSERWDGVILQEAVDQANVEYVQARDAIRSGTFSPTFAKHLLRLKKGPSRWSFHRAHPEISVDDYREFRQSQWAEKVRSKTIIYLDINHWINLRKVVLKDPTAQKDYDELLDLLKAMTAEGRIVCPLSFIHFEELMKQSDVTTRFATASLMDELSGSVCLVHPQEIYRIEINLLLGKKIFPNRTFPSEDQIWTNPMWITGVLLPDLKEFEAAERDIALKGIIDVAWESRLLDLVETINQNQFPKRDYSNHATALKSDAVFYETNPDSFKKIREKEIGLVWHSTGALEMMENIARTFFEQCPKECEEFRLKKPNEIFDPKCLASMQILAGINTTFVMHPKGVDANDLLDAAHAALAIPYCDVFVCDNPMAHRLKSGPLRFDKVYQTEIYGTAGELIRYLKNLAIAKKTNIADNVNDRERSLPSSD